MNVGKHNEIDKRRIVYDGKTDPVEVCAHAAAADLKHVLVIGIGKDGEHYFAGSTSSIRNIKALVDDFKASLDL